LKVSISLWVAGVLAKKSPQRELQLVGRINQFSNCAEDMRGDVTLKRNCCL